MSARKKKDALRLAHLFTDHAVLQRDLPAPVWGWTAPGLRVRVTLGPYTAETRSGDDGRFLTRLPPMPAGGPYVLEVNTPDPDAHARLTDVMVGEVWVCSGQSNMEWPVSQTRFDAQTLATADRNIRSLRVPQRALLGRQSDVQAAWQVASPETVAGFTAVGFFFGRRLAQELDVAVGLINTSWGGSRIETWISREELVLHGRTRDEVSRYEASVAGAGYWGRFDPFDPDSPQAQDRLLLESHYPRDPGNTGAAGGLLVKPPALPEGLGNHQSPYMLNDNMIQPLIPYAIRGAAWYQGESNGAISREYGWMLRALIRDWRRAWGQGDFTFLTVQLANYLPPLPYQANSTWATVREGQLASLQEANTGLAVAIDIGESHDIHPRNKQDVGLRLAQWALARTYGRPLVPSGPLYRDHLIAGDRIRLRFDHTGGGLVARGGDLKTFVIAGADGKFVPAAAEIDGDAVWVRSPDVPEPVAVRYAWADNPDGCNLYNQEGLPASPFRTDAW
jgi:sialate O-acetylesterase